MQHMGFWPRLLEEIIDRASTCMPFLEESYRNAATVVVHLGILLWNPKVQYLIQRGPTLYQLLVSVIQFVPSYRIRLRIFSIMISTLRSTK